MDNQELRRYFSLALRWWWLIVLCTALGGGAAYAGSAQMTPVYSASTTLLVRQAPAAGTSDYTSLLASERLARTYSEMLTGKPVLEAVIAQLGLEESPNSMAGRISVELVRDTQLIQVTVEDTSPTRAAAIADAVASVFAAQNEVLQEARYGGSLANLQVQIDQVSAQMVEAQGQIQALGTPTAVKGQAEAARLQELMASYRGTYAVLVQSYEQMRVTAAQSTDDVMVYASADVPGRAVRPRTMQNTALGAVVGMMIAAGVVVLIDYLDDTIKTPDDVRQAIGLETLGVIGRAKGDADDLIVVWDAHSPVAEAFRSLRTNVRFAAVDAPLRTLLVTSPTMAEGKSFTVANLAAAMAEADVRVVAVDADLRRPRQHRIFGLEEGPGLTGAVLRGELNGNMRAVRYEGKLSVLPAGELPHNPTEVLGSKRMAAVLAEVAQGAEFVLIDSPPVLPVADAAVLARQVDGVLLVLQAGRTRREAAQRALESLQKVGANVIGAVLNDVSRARGSGRYYYHGYYYGEGGKQRRRRPRVHEMPHGTTVIVRPPSSEEIEAAARAADARPESRMSRRAEAERRGERAGRGNGGSRGG